MFKSKDKFYRESNYEHKKPGHHSQVIPADRLYPVPRIYSGYAPKNLPHFHQIHSDSPSSPRHRVYSPQMEELLEMID
ncbi:hypothetical protein [Nitrosomonas sp.]|uniref:hypothetical protein n=1 Tax=Nitrosomonas sp. TaxID=42353 RepID=UPI00207F93F7|nr:hypothetical protein [Nitrosomonas sp.]GJL75334.1 MAG: hypothetical protein NMNS02_14400 [Nitrosomonas sp.]